MNNDHTKAQLDFTGSKTMDSTTLRMCAHSPVHFEFDGKTIMDGTDVDTTVSAAAIYLLRPWSVITQEKPALASIYSLLRTCNV